MASEANLGETPNVDVGVRDAVHVAVIAVVCDEELSPGREVSLAEEGLIRRCAIAGAGIGIVDPYLRQPAAKGDVVWLCLFPRSVTGMRHHWRHSAFPDESPARTVQVSEARLLELIAKAVKDGISDSEEEPVNRFIRTIER